MTLHPLQLDYSPSVLDVPPLVSFISAIVFSAQVYGGRTLDRSELGDESVREDDNTTFSCLHVNFRPEERTIAYYEILRILGIAGLLSLALISLSPQRCVQNAAPIVTYFYCLLLSIAFFLSTEPSTRSSLTNHLNTILGLTFAIYIYHDLHYLGTYYESQAHTSWQTLVRTALLSIVGGIVPLFIPGRYIPVDNKDPRPPPPDQTASIFSLFTYSFLNHIVWLGYCVPHIAFEDLPPLADYDHVKYLRKKAFRYLDPDDITNRRHIFFNLVRAFRWEVAVLSMPMLVRAVANFSYPLAINQLLGTLKATEEQAMIRPWVWVALLFIGPMTSSLCLELYFYFSKRLVIQMEALIMHTIFERVLKISVVSGGQTHGADNVAATVPGHKHDVKSEAHNLFGKISSLVTTDMINIGLSIDIICILVYIPPHFIIGVWFLYSILGWSSIIGLSTLMAFLALPAYIAKTSQRVETVRMKFTDARVQAVTEALNLARMIKLFGWENKMEKTLNERREEELMWIKKREFLSVGLKLSNIVATMITMLTTYLVHERLLLRVGVDVLFQTVVFKKELSTAAVFSSAAVFSTLRSMLELTFQVIQQAVTGKVSLDRVNEFLTKSDILQQVTEQNGVGLIGFRDAAFTWNKHGGLSHEQFQLNVRGELALKHGSFNAIVGPTASGKTSLLMALLGEMNFSPLSLDGWYNLPRAYGVAYAAQESWVLNMTIRDNIIFGSVFDEDRYQKVVMQCCLEADLAELPAGDNTEVGEKGVTLSGGQKARITLARAVYSQASILLLDDVLAALDIRTAKWIVEKCFKGDLIKGRTVLLVTHNVNIIHHVVDAFVAISNQGEVCLTENTDFNINIADINASETFSEYQSTTLDRDVTNAATQDDMNDTGGKLVVQEEVAIGRVNWETVRMYLSALCGRYPIFVIPTFIAGLLSTEALTTAQVWFLGQWGNAYDTTPMGHVPATWYLSIYGTLSVVSVALSFVLLVAFISQGIAASKQIHGRLIHSVLHATLRWLDMTPTSRILARCTQDIGTIDSTLPTYLKWLFDMIAVMLVKLGMIVFITPTFLLPGILVAIAGAWLSNFYIASQLSINREASRAKAPIIAHFVTLTTGLVSIRAYGIQPLVLEELRSRVDRQTRASLVLESLSRWITVRISFISAMFSSSLAAYLVFLPSSDRSLSDIANSLERAHQYMQIDQEPKPSSRGIPPAYWPASGELRVSNLSASYKENGPTVLHDLSFSIRSGEHIGIVGRTGSGKSSLILSLLRSIHTRGSVFYDGIEIGTLNLDALRSKISVIPQTPQLFTGTLRENLDPFSEYDDAHLHGALELSGFFTLNGLPGFQKLALDTMINNAGSTLSVGQRQILALARALVRGSKVLILDEATASIDHETDSIIHSSLRRLEGEITILTIAHRLHTIADADKVLVLDNGKLVEFDTPQALMRNEDGIFRRIVFESGEQDRLNDLINSVREAQSIPG
ncbi:P-loop containing nucleoside triphosphate hydrolase protein [Cyathus striatus]|nr:P-loop containing nucleoside triphosphate hydrolase protein [Cyathus striatus]